VDLEDPLHELLFRVLKCLHELGDVGADHEAVLAAGDEQAAHSWLSADDAQRRSELGERNFVELVDRVALEVEPQLGDPSVEHGALDGLTFEPHQTSATK
jgi:hypothetical protein